jgi:hypothetical protein
MIFAVVAMLGLAFFYYALPPSPTAGQAFAPLAALLVPSVPDVSNPSLMGLLESAPLGIGPIIKFLEASVSLFLSVFSLNGQGVSLINAAGLPDVLGALFVGLLSIVFIAGFLDYVRGFI